MRTDPEITKMTAIIGGLIGCYLVTWNSKLGGLTRKEKGSTAWKLAVRAKEDPSLMFWAGRGGGAVEINHHHLLGLQRKRIYWEDSQLSKRTGRWRYHYETKLPVLVSSRCCNKVPKPGWLKTTEIYVSQLWRPEVWNKGAGRAGLGLSPNFWCLNSSALPGLWMHPSNHMASFPLYVFI